MTEHKERSTWIELPEDMQDRDGFSKEGVLAPYLSLCVEDDQDGVNAFLLELGASGVMMKIMAKISLWISILERHKEALSDIYKVAESKTMAICNNYVQERGTLTRVVLAGRSADFTMALASDIELLLSLLTPENKEQRLQYTRRLLKEIEEIFPEAVAEIRDAQNIPGKPDIMLRIVDVSFSKFVKGFVKPMQDKLSSMQNKLPVKADVSLTDLPQVHLTPDGSPGVLGDPSEGAETRHALRLVVDAFLREQERKTALHVQPKAVVSQQMDDPNSLFSELALFKSRGGQVN